MVGTIDEAFEKAKKIAIGRNCAMATIHVDVVSAEEAIFSGEAKFVALPGESRRARHLPAPHAADHAHQARRGAHRARRQRRGGVRLRRRRHPRSAAEQRDRAGRHRDPRQGPRRSQGHRGQARGRGSDEERQERHRHRQGAERIRGDGRADRGASRKYRQRSRRPRRTVQRSGCAAPSEGEAPRRRPSHAWRSLAAVAAQRAGDADRPASSFGLVWPGAEREVR